MKANDKSSKVAPKPIDNINKTFTAKLDSLIIKVWDGLKTDYKYCMYITGLVVGLLCLRSGNIGNLALVGLIPLFIYLNANKSMTRKQFLTDFYVLGFIISAFAYYFLSQSTLETWAVGVSGLMLFLAPFFTLIFLSSITALSTMILGYVIYKIKPSYRIYSLILLWPLMEILRSEFFSLANFGPGGSVLPSFNFGTIAIHASGTPLIYISRFVGFYGLSGVVVLVNVCIYKLAVYRLKSKLSLIYGLVLLQIVGLTVIAWQKGNNMPNQRSIKVAAIKLTNEGYVDYQGSLPDLNPGTDLVVLPEYAYYSVNDYINNVTSKLSDKGVAVMSLAEVIDGYSKNNLSAFDSKGKMITKQQKSFLIPGGEYMPVFMRTFLELTGKQDSLKLFDEHYAVKKSVAPEHIINVSDNLRVGGLACSGVTRIDRYQSLTRQGANVLTNSAQLTLFPYNSFYFQSARNLARFQAVVNNRPFIQSARGGESFILDNQGRVIIRSQGTDVQLLQATIMIGP